MNGFVFNLSGGETVEESKKLMQVVRPFFATASFRTSKDVFETSENDIVLDAMDKWSGATVGLGYWKKVRYICTKGKINQVSELKKMSRKLKKARYFHSK